MGWFRVVDERVQYHGVERKVFAAWLSTRDGAEVVDEAAADVRAVYVNIDPAATEQLKSQWNRYGDGVPLIVLESPYRSLMEPLLEYIDQLQAARPADYVTVILPEFVPKRWWQHLLHNQRALLIKGALLFRSRVVVTSVPFHLER